MAETYLFDLYGTLIDIHTDQTMPSLWKRMAIHYSIYGADWKPQQLKEAYYRMCGQEAEKLLGKTVQEPEIDLLTVFRRMYEEAPAHHRTEKPAVIDEDWLFMTANVFRTISRKKLKLYPDTVPVLKQLKKEGKKIYLLSNAQHAFTVPEMEMTGIYDFFDGIFISSDCGIKKPQKEFMEKLLETYHIDRQSAVMIGNEVRSDILTAYRCGVDSVYLNTSSLSDREIRKQMRDYINDPAYKPVIIKDGRLSHLLPGGNNA